MRATAPSIAIFAATMIAVSVLGLAAGDFAPIWVRVPKTIPLRDLLALMSNVLLLTAGVGLVSNRISYPASKMLFGYLLAGLLGYKLPIILHSPLQEVTYQNFGMTAVILAAAWVILIRLAPNSDRPNLEFFYGWWGLSLARRLYAISLFAFGLSHFFYLEMTAPLIPVWLGWQTGWAWFTGCTYLAASVAILTGRFARYAAALSALQMALFVPLVWMPIVASRGMSEFKWYELINTCVLAVSGLVVWDSYNSLRGLRIGDAENV